jgi:hypothetical protein
MAELVEVRRLKAVLRSAERSFYSLPYALYLVDEALRKIKRRD